MASSSGSRSRSRWLGDPSLVFLDEPTAGMDPLRRATTWPLMRDLRDRGATVVLTTHAMHEAEQLCDRVGIVHHGRLVAYGSRRELTTNAGDDMRFSAATGLDVEKLAQALELPADAVTRDAARATTSSTRPRPPRSSPRSPRGSRTSTCS